MSILKTLLSITVLSLAVSEGFGQAQGEVYIPDTSFKVIANGTEKKICYFHRFSFIAWPSGNKSKLDNHFASRAFIFMVDTYTEKRMRFDDHLDGFGGLFCAFHDLKFQ